MMPVIENHLLQRNELTSDLFLPNLTKEQTLRHRQRSELVCLALGVLGGELQPVRPPHHLGELNKHKEEGASRLGDDEE